MRAAILVLLCAAVVLLISPFAISSFFIDQRGIMVSGHVYSKDERVVVRDSGWTRSLEVTVQYDPPRESTVAFLKAEVDAARFDGLKKGDRLQLRYLRREDVPHVPGADALRQMHLLPTARLADQRAWSGLQRAFQTRSTLALEVVLAVIAILFLWRLLRVPYFGWAVAAAVVSGLAVLAVHDFPTPTPAPQNGVRSASGTVRSIDRIEWLFRSTHQEGFKADQPIQIVGVQFIPEGRTEQVLAIDLIDAGSVSPLRENATVGIDYESASPRTAYLRGASRQFVRRNLQGIEIELIASLAVIVILLVVASVLGKGYRRLVNRKST